MFAQEADTKPVIILYSPETDKSDKTLELLSHTIKDNISFTLRLMGLYNLQVNLSEYSYNDIDVIKQSARSAKADNVIFGKITKNASGTIQIVLSVYDKQKDLVILTEKASIDNIFDNFWPRGNSGVILTKFRIKSVNICVMKRLCLGAFLLFRFS